MNNIITHRHVAYLLAGMLALSGCDDMNNGASAKQDLPSQEWLMAETMERSGNLDGAIAAYTTLAENSKYAKDAYLHLAAIHRHLGHNEQALNAAKQAHTLAADDPEVVLLYAHIMVDYGQTKEAILLLDGLTAMQPDNVAAYNAKAVAYDKAGNHMAAQELYQKILSLTPESLSARNNLAMSYILNNQIEDALTVLEALNNSEHSSPTIRQNLALAYGIKGDMNKARELNLQDVSEEETKENLRFYKEYAKELKAKQTNDAILELLPPTDLKPVLTPEPPTQESTPAAGDASEESSQPTTLFGLELKGDYPSRSARRR